DFRVERLLPISSQDTSLLEEALHDNTQSPVLDQVIFRLDFPAWLATRTDRDRRLVQDLMRGERPQDVAQRYGLTPGRASRLPRAFQTDWLRFGGEPAVDPAV